MNIKKGDIVELKIEKYAFEGKGVARVSKSDLLGLEVNSKDDKNYVVFVQGSYPGDKVKAQLLKIKNSFAEAKTVELIARSSERQEARCKYFGVCGGCKQQDLNYEFQIKYKQQQVEEIFTKLGGFSGIEVELIIPSEKLFFYRNKMEFSFGDRKWLTNSQLAETSNIDRHFALGLHIPKIYDKVLDVDECLLQSEASNRILNFTRKFFKDRNISVYSTKSHTGFLRNLVIRQSQKTNDLMVNLVTSEENDKLMTNYSDLLLSEIPEITTIVNNISKKKASIAVGDYEKVIHGTGFIFDEIGKYKFRISANSFFQTNTLQAEKLYQTAQEFADLNRSEVVYDLYSGAGTIAIFISEKTKQVIGFETVESAITDAKINAELNKVSNVKFFTADLYKSFLSAVEENKLPKPDMVITDPPRAGMHINTVNDVISLSPKKIVYVSCNPTTQVRDIKLMVDAGYKLIKIRPVDMFPHTFHIENVALLQK